MHTLVMVKVSNEIDVLIMELLCFVGCQYGMTSEGLQAEHAEVDP